MPVHPAYQLVFDGKYVKLFKVTLNAICTFGLRMRQINIRFDSIMEISQYFGLPPWYIKPPDIVFDLVHLKKGHTNALVYRQHLLEIKIKFCDFIQTYTDGS